MKESSVEYGNNLWSFMEFKLSQTTVMYSKKLSFYWNGHVI